MRITTRKPRLPRGRFLVTLLLALTFLLTACGAEVSTVLNLENGVKGSRVITAKLSEQDLEYLQGGTAALDASIRKHLPAELVFNGLDSKDNDSQASFTLSFGSEQEYIDKVTALLKAGQSTTEPEIEIVIEDSTFLSGVSVNENFSSADLLGWMSDGLVSDGVVAEEKKSNVFGSAGKTEVAFGGKKYDAGSQATMTEMIDNGFAQILLETTIKADGTFGQKVSYRMAEGKRASLGKKLTDFLTKATPAGGILDESFGNASDGDSWDINFTAANLAELNTFTNQALDSKENKYSLEEAPAPSNPTLIRTTLNSKIDCASICSPNGNGVKQTIIAPGSWKYVDGPANASRQNENPEIQSITFDGTESRVVYERSTPLQSMAVDTKLGANGSVTQTFRFVVSAASLKQVGKAFEKLLAPSEQLGTFSVDNGKEKTTYTAVVTAPTVEEYNTKIQGYVPGAALTTIRPEGWHIWPEYTVVQKLPLGATLASGGITEGLESVISLPAMHSFSTKTTANPAIKVEGGKISAKGLEASAYMEAKASGPTISGLVFLGIMLLLVLLAALFAVIFRKKLAKLTRKIWSERGKVQVATAKIASTVVQAGAAAGVAASTLSAQQLEEPSLDASDPRLHSQLFTEADLH